MWDAAADNGAGAWTTANPDAALMTLDPATGDLVLAVDTDAGLAGSLPADFVSSTVPARIVYESTHNGAQTFDDFDITFKSKCWLTTFTSASTTSELHTYNLDDPRMEIDVQFEASDDYASCPYSCTFELDDAISQSWVGLDQAAGVTSFTPTDLYTMQPWVESISCADGKVYVELAESSPFWADAM